MVGKVSDPSNSFRVAFAPDIVFAIFGVLSTCPRGCLSEKVEKIEKKMEFFFVAFFDQKHVETSRNGIKSVKK